jgi:hypothetical protein
MRPVAYPPDKLRRCVVYMQGWGNTTCSSCMAYGICTSHAYSHTYPSYVLHVRRAVVSRRGHLHRASLPGSAAQCRVAVKCIGFGSALQ